MGIEVKIIESSDYLAWDAYVNNHPEANIYHLSAWKEVIKKTYGQNVFYLIALRSSERAGHGLIPEASKTERPSPSNLIASLPHAERVTGILPLVHLKHFLFGNILVSMPYFDMGGILASDVKSENALLMEAIKLGQRLKVKAIELRQTKSLKFFKST